MSTAQVIWHDEETVSITGELSFVSVMDLYQQTSSLIQNKNKLAIDLGQVTRSDSAGLALLIEWCNAAQKQRVPLRFINPPKQIVRMASISGVVDFLELVE